MKLAITILGAILISSVTGGMEHPHGKSITILYNTEGDNLMLSYDGLKDVFLHPEVEDRKAVVISIVGAYRGGKSFFLDYCLRYLYANYKSVNTTSKSSFARNKNWWGEPDEPLTGFSWKYGSDADTKGVLMWSDVFLHEHDGEKIAIFLMDTQGLFELERSSNIDVKIFSTTCLISSTQILNINGFVKEDQLEHLKMVTDFSKLASERQKSNVKEFQNLLFLMRDWSDEDYDYGYVGGEIYLHKKVLNLQNSRSEIAQSVRKNIKNSYENISMFLMPHPGTTIFKKKFDGRWSKLDNDFFIHLKELIESLLSPESLVKKKMFNNELTSKELMDYATSVFLIFRSTDIPNIKSVFNIIVETELKKIAQDVIKYYKDEMENRIDYNRSNFAQALNENHKIIQDLSILKFKDAPKRSDEVLERDFENGIKNETDFYFLNWKTTVLAMHSAILEGIMLKIEAQEKLHAEYIKRLEQEKLAIEQMLRQEIDKANRKKPGARFWACKIFTLGIHKCR